MLYIIGHIRIKCVGSKGVFILSFQGPNYVCHAGKLHTDRFIQIMGLKL